MKYLITYVCNSYCTPGSPITRLGCDITEDPMEWIASTQEHENETYFLINQLPITDEQAMKYQHDLKGM